LRISEILEQLDAIPDGERRGRLEPLLKVFSPVSLTLLAIFQDTQENLVKTYQEFVVDQNKVIRVCVSQEIERTDVRARYGLPVLTLETEI